MSKARKALVAKLEDTAAVTAKIGTAPVRLYPRQAPRGTARPYATYAWDGESRTYHMGGDSGLMRATFGITSFAGTYSASIDAGTAIRDALNAIRGTIGDAGAQIKVSRLHVDTEFDAITSANDGADLGIWAQTTDFELDYREI